MYLMKHTSSKKHDWNDCKYSSVINEDIYIYICKSSNLPKTRSFGNLQDLFIYHCYAYKWRNEILKRKQILIPTFISMKMTWRTYCFNITSENYLETCSASRVLIFISEILEKCFSFRFELICKSSICQWPHRCKSVCQWVSW